MSNVRLWSPEWDQTFVVDGRHVDPAARSIKTAETVTEVEPRVMAVLIALAGKPNKILRRQDLIDEVWRGAPGADQSLSNAISLLRRALGDANPDKRLIQTVPKQGYRLTAPVKRKTAHDAKEQQIAAWQTANTLPGVKGKFNPRLAYRLMVFGALFAVAALSGIVFSFREGRDAAPTGIERISKVEPQSIAVLPFVNMTADLSNDYFSDGLAEEILNALTQIDSLKVASRTDSFQFRGKDASIEEISNRLRVANVLEGSVRKEGEQLRITAQLIAASDGRHIWSSTYDRSTDDIFAIQQDIALNIADALAAELSNAERELITMIPTNNIKAYEHYLIGNYQLQQWTAEGNRRAVDSFESAVALDPEFVEAQLAMGRAYYYAGTHYGWMSPGQAIPKVKASLVYGIASTKPLTRAAALSIYGDVLAWNDKDWQGALAAFQRAYELSGTPTLGYALTNSVIGNHDAAIGILNKRLAEGDKDNGTRNNLAWAYFNARRYKDSIREVTAVLSADDGFSDGYRVLGRAHLLLGKTDEAIEDFSRAAQLLDGGAVARSDLAVALARANRKAEARAILEDILNTDDYVPAPLIAQIYANLGESDTAFEWLEKGMEDGARGIIFLKINPLYDPLRNDPRFSQLLTRLNLESGIRSPRD